jgi:hypothetical protein
MHVAMSDLVSSPLKFYPYYRRVVDKASKIGGGWIRDNFAVPVGLVLLSALYAYFAYQVRPDWRAIVPILWVNGIIILLFSFVSIGTSAWQLDSERILEIETLRQYKKEKEDARVRLKFGEFLVREVSHDFGNGECELAFALILKIANEVHKLPGKIAPGVLAKVTYEDEDGRTFTQYGRWADSDQPETLSYLNSKNELLPMDFLPGSEHELDIAAKFPKDYSCYAVNNESFPKIRHEKQQLDGPIIAVTVRLMAENVHEEWEFSFTNQQTGKGFLVPINRSSLNEA